MFALLSEKKLPEATYLVIGELFTRVDVPRRPMEIALGDEEHRAKTGATLKWYLTPPGADQRPLNVLFYFARSADVKGIPLFAAHVGRHLKRLSRARIRVANDAVYEGGGGWANDPWAEAVERELKALNKTESSRIKLLRTESVSKALEGGTPSFDTLLLKDSAAHHALHKEFGIAMQGQFHVQISASIGDNIFALEVPYRSVENDEEKDVDVPSLIVGLAAMLDYGNERDGANKLQLALSNALKKRGVASGSFHIEPAGDDAPGLGVSSLELLREVRDELAVSC